MDLSSTKSLVQHIGTLLAPGANCRAGLHPPPPACSQLAQAPWMEPHPHRHRELSGTPAYGLFLRFRPSLSIPSLLPARLTSKIAAFAQVLVWGSVYKGIQGKIVIMFKLQFSNELYNLASLSR